MADQCPALYIPEAMSLKKKETINQQQDDNLL
jgi:hypothetical protein